LSKIIRWNEEKNQLLIVQRGLSFEMVLDKLEKKDIIAHRSHPNKTKYPDQYIFILKLKEYICYVPFIENDEEIFLKTIIPSRKLKKSLKENKSEKR